MFVNNEVLHCKTPFIKIPRVNPRRMEEKKEIKTSKRTQPNQSSLDLWNFLKYYVQRNDRVLPDVSPRLQFICVPYQVQGSRLSGDVKVLFTMYSLKTLYWFQMLMEIIKIKPWHSIINFQNSLTVVDCNRQCSSGVTTKGNFSNVRKSHRYVSGERQKEGDRKGTEMIFANYFADKAMLC